MSSRRPAPADPNMEASADDDQGGRDELAGREGATHNKPTDRVAAGPLEEKASDAVEHQIGGEDASRGRASPVIGGEQRIQAEVEE